jgi:hypothetical protein
LIIIMFGKREQEPRNSSVYIIRFRPVKFSSRRLEVSCLYSNSNWRLVDKTHVLPLSPPPTVLDSNKWHTQFITVSTFSLPLMLTQLC